MSAPEAKEPLWRDHILPHTHELFPVTSVRNIQDVSRVQLDSASTGCVSVFCTSEVIHTFLPSKSSSRSAKVCWSRAAMHVSSFSCLPKVIASSCLLKERGENHFALLLTLQFQPLCTHWGSETHSPKYEKCVALETHTTTVTHPHLGKILVVPEHTQGAGNQKITINKACKEMVCLQCEVRISAGLQKHSICQDKDFAYPYSFKADH